MGLIWSMPKPLVRQRNIAEVDDRFGLELSRSDLAEFAARMIGSLLGSDPALSPSFDFLLVGDGPPQPGNQGAETARLTLGGKIKKHAGRLMISATLAVTFAVTHESPVLADGLCPPGSSEYPGSWYDYNGNGIKEANEIVCRLDNPPPQPTDPRRVAAGEITAVSPGAAPGATAVLANLTMVDGMLPGYITADKCSALIPGPQAKSNGNHDIAVAIANLSVLPIDTDGKFCLYNQVPVNLIADVQGYFAPSTTDGQLFIPSTPTRKLDTRIAPLTTPPAGSITKIETGTPVGTTAVLVNLTMVDGAAPGYITADKCAALIPGPQTKSSGNHNTSAAIANVAVVPVDTDGSFCIYNQQTVNLVVDLEGSFTPPTPGAIGFTLLTPSRQLDTRLAPSTRPTAGTITRINTGAANDTTAVLVNLTMTDGAAPGYITADKCTSLTPGPQTQSSGNHGTTTAIANLAVVPIDTDGSFCIYNQQPVNLVVDLQGTFSPTGTQHFFPTGPTRVIDTR